ncbi:T9SS type B sorting domain-containing protein [Hymenobacter agri]
MSPLDTDVFIATDIPPSSVVNSSPMFAAHAVTQACLNEASVMNNTAYDADGDRLSYSLAAPVNNAQTTMYATGYSLAQPFGADGTVALDEQTGTLTYRCRRQGAFELALDVKEYRVINGREVLLSTMRRDIQIVVRICQNNVSTNQAPVFTAASLATRDFQVQEGQSLDFNFTATDPEGQAEVMTVRSILLDGPGGIVASLNGDPGNGSSAMPLGTVVTNGTPTVTGTFHLLTTCGMARAIPYDVLVTVEDADGCDRKSTTVLFRIMVVSPSGPSGISGNANVCTGTLATYTATGSAYSSYQWTVQGGQLIGATTGATVQVRWDGSDAGRLTVTGVLQGSCRTTATSKTVDIVPGLAISGPTAYCRTTSTGLQYTVAGPPLAYTWTLTGGTIVSGQGTNAVVVDIAAGSSAQLSVVAPAGPLCGTDLAIKPDDSCLYFYNVITPNADGQNDVFEVENIARHPGTSLTVFNRWGRKVYESADYHNDFGSTAAVGVYYYYCQLADGTTYKGWFEVMR